MLMMTMMCVCVFLCGVCAFVSVWQYFTGGAGAEGEIARYLDKIKTITKLGYNFTVPSFRTKVDGYIIRNLDYGKGLSFFLS